MDQLIAFHGIFGSCVLRPPQKDYFFAVPCRGSFGRILTMQLEPPKYLDGHLSVGAGKGAVTSSFFWGHSSPYL